MCSVRQGTYAMEFAPARHLSFTDFGKHRPENEFKDKLRMTKGSLLPPHSLQPSSSQHSPIPGQIKQELLASKGIFQCGQLAMSGKDDLGITVEVKSR
ncbi:hypothetical protein TURU_143468 [Turdus rufiventris]|nr:hypothetical protein TURU_143468 [Turdus rufiventris]